ncbi:MAG TPA: hypothetical protein VHE35_29875 [Kofleriaceae bacterium]|nr:hypothetical protein [Kofleriaceae bacterium]
MLIDRALAALALVAGAALGACGSGSLDDVAFEHHEALPGFDVALPAGERLQDHHTPAGGEIMVRSRSAVVGVTWQVGNIPQEQLATFGSATMKALGVAIGAGSFDQQELPMKAPDYGMQLLAATDKDVVMVLSIIQCVHANVTVTAVSMASNDRGRARRFDQRFRAGLACRQDGPPLAIASALPAFDLGEHIAYLPGSDPPAYFGDDGARWYVTPGAAAQERALEHPDATAAMFAGFGFKVVGQEPLPPTGDGWKMLRLTVELGDDHGQVMVGTLRCSEDAGYTVIYVNPLALGAKPGPSDLRRVSCPSAGVDEASLPTVSARFGAACDGGAGLACALLADLADEEPELLPDVDGAGRRARACKLGYAAACATP